MELRYRGILYPASTNLTAVELSPQTRRFLGQSYCLPRHTQPVIKTNLVARKYRGVAYRS